MSGIKRREFITLLGSAAATWPLTARAQQAERIRQVGVLIGFAESDPSVRSWLAAFRGALAKLGWTEGSNLRIELRWAGDDPDRMKTFAKEQLRGALVLQHHLRRYSRARRFGAPSVAAPMPRVAMPLRC
jgi:hypothetical protein